MDQQTGSFYHQPERKHLIIFSLLWVVGNGLLLLAATDFFTESPFNPDYSLLSFPFVGSTIAVIQLYRNYEN